MDCRKLCTEEELMEECKKYSEIMLYGCGEVGQTVLRRLNQREIKINGFIVTEKKDTKIAEQKVFSVHEIPVSVRGGGIVVATRERFHQEILAEIQRLDVKHVVCISDELFETIKNKVKWPRKKLLFNVHIVEHCNLNCRGCYHFSSIAGEEYLKPEEYAKDMRRLGELFFGELDEVFIMGGEPLLHPEVESSLKLQGNIFQLEILNC